MKNIFEELKEVIGDEPIWDDNYSFEVDGVTYIVTEVEEEDTIDEGKYQYGATIFEVCSEDGQHLFYVRQSFSQCGSYFSHQERDYDYIELVEKATKTIEYWRSV